MPIQLMLDSGAFSAWSQKASIDLDAYIDFCLTHQEHLEYIVNLDVIPGEWGQKRLPPEEVRRAAEQGWENYWRMRDAGVDKDKLIHVFHQGEPFEWLQMIVKEVPYIGLSPANDRTTPEKTTWLDDCMPHVTDKDGMPIVKWHGFAVTSIGLMLRYPWYSVDSASWSIVAGMGKIYVPRFSCGKPDYLSTPWQLPISPKSPDVASRGEHFLTLSPLQQAEITAYLASKGFSLGKSKLRRAHATYKPKKPNERWYSKPDAEGYRVLEIVEEWGLTTDHAQRAEWNALYFLELQKYMPPWPWPFKQRRRNRGFGL